MDDRIKNPDETQQIIDDFAEELANEVEDFDLENTKVVYEVWALGYDADMNATDFELILDSGYTDLEEARKCFDYMTVYDNVMPLLERAGLPNDTKHVHIMLEMCVDNGDVVECQDIVEETEIF